MSKSPNTVVRLSRSVESDGRTVDSVVIAAEPGAEALPYNVREHEWELDALTLVNVIAARTGLSRPAVERLSTPDFFAVALAIFIPPRQAQVVSLEERRKAKI